MTPAHAPPPPPLSLLTVEGIHKRFGANEVLKGVSLQANVRAT